jgi:hypothetical protein
MRFAESQTIDSKGKLSSSSPSQGPGYESHKSGQEQTRDSQQQSESDQTEHNQFYVLDDQEKFCWKNPKAPFYQRESDGAVCCRGKQLPVITVRPETEGECAITTKFGADGLLDSDSLV